MMKTLETHKWFANQFKSHEQKYLNYQAYNSNIYAILLVWFSLKYESVNTDKDVLAFIYPFILVIFYLIELSDYPFKVYMRFTRPGIFYKNTHYIFSGTKIQLKRIFDKMRKEVEAEKQEFGFRYGDHNNLLDIPLDVYKEDAVDSIRVNNENYIYSHWNLYSYKNAKELQAAVKEINIKTGGFINEIIYI